MPLRPHSLAELELIALLDTAVDAVVVIGHHGRIEQFNRSAERLFGYSAAEALGQDVSMLMPPPHRSRHASYIERYLRTGEAHIIGVGREVGARRKDGTVFPARLSIGELRTGDAPHFVAFVHDLTADKQAQVDLVESHRRAQSYLDMAEVVLLALDEHARVTMINRKGCEILGYSEAELCGQNWIEHCVPEPDRPIVEKVFEGLVRDGDLDEHGYHENTVLTRDGRFRLLAWRNRVLRDPAGNTIVGTLSSGEDVTERRAVERALKRSQRLLRAAERVARVGDFEVHVPSAGTDHLSPVVRQILGLTERADLEDGEAFLAYIHGDDREHFDAALAAVEDETDTLDLRYRIARPDGGQRFVHLIARAQRHEGGVTLTGMLHDITERQHAEEEAQRTRARLTHVSRLSTMGEMAGGLAHELNQPLTAISVYASACARLLEQDGADLKEDLSGALEQINAQAIRAGEVIRRLRAMVKQTGTRRETVDCNQVVRELIVLAEADARTSDVAMRVELAGEPLPVSVDVVQIQQVLLNLIRNAIDATLEGDGTVRRIEIRTAVTAEDAAEVTVTDYGCGLPADAAEHIFEPFFTTKASGTGLGLSISRNIVRDHGGRLQCLSNPQGGAIFSFTLPLTRE